MPVSNAILHLFLAFLGAFLGPCLGHARGLFLRFSNFCLIDSIVFSSIFPSFLIFLHLSMFSEHFSAGTLPKQRFSYIFPGFVCTFRARILYFSMFSEHFSAGSWPGAPRRASEEDVFS